MLTFLNLVYVLPVVIALIVAGLVVNGRIAGTARTLMWSGIALTCVTRLAAMFTPYLLTSRGSTQLYAVVNVVTAVLSAVGIVLLVVAIGAAARGPRPAIGYPGAPNQPGWPSNQPGQPSNQPGQPAGFGPQGYGPPTGGHPGAGQGHSGAGQGQPGAGQGHPGAGGQPGQWSPPGQWGNQH